MTYHDNDIERTFENEKNLRMLINNTDNPIWLVDAACNIVECNESFKKWVKYFIGRELGKGDNVLYDGIDKTYADKFEMCYRLALSGRAFKSVEDMVVDNEQRYTTVSFNPVYDEHGQIAGVSCFARDITEQRKHLHKIEEQNMALKEIAFIESHKIRGPVATILGLSQLFSTDNPADPVNKEILDALVKVTNDLDLIIREVVDKTNEIVSQP